MEEEIKIIREELEHSTIIATVKTHWLDFEVYEITGWIDGTPVKTEYRSKDGVTDTLNIEDAEPYFKGFIKWDGCAELDLRTHICGYTTDIQEVLKTLYQIAKDHMENFDSDLANFK